MAVIQDCAFLDLKPIALDVNLRNALSKQNIRIDVPSTFTVAVDPDPSTRQNAAERLLGLDRQTIGSLAQDIIFGQWFLQCKVYLNKSEQNYQHSYKVQVKNLQMKLLEKQKLYNLYNLQIQRLNNFIHTHITKRLQIFFGAFFYVFNFIQYKDLLYLFT